MLISIHAPARGATNSNRQVLLFCRISIHAPARGATSFSGIVRALIGISIHAPARGATILLFSKQNSDLFQSTLPRGERLAGRKLVEYLQDFNPRSREGSDVKSAFILIPGKTDFNPRSREGSDSFGYVAVIDQGDFNPRSREGSDIQYSSGHLSYILFQSTLPRGERRLLYRSKRH